LAVHIQNHGKLPAKSLYKWRQNWDACIMNCG